MVRAGSARSTAVTERSKVKSSAERKRETPTPQPPRSPICRTTSSQASLGLRRLLCFTNKSSRRFVPLRFLSASDHACFVCSVVNALASTHCATNRLRINPLSTLVLFLIVERSGLDCIRPNHFVCSEGSVFDARHFIASLSASRT